MRPARRAALLSSSSLILGRSQPSSATTSFTISSLLETAKHHYHAPVRPSAPRLLNIQLNPSSSTYAMEGAFEEPTFRFYCEGNEVDFKNELRDRLKEILPPSVYNFTKQPAPSSGVQETLQLYRSLQRKPLVNYAQVRSSFQRLLAYYEVLATAHPALALLAAENLTFAGLVYTHFHVTEGTPAAQRKRELLESIDSGRATGCVAWRELIAEEPPLNTEVRYDYHDKCFYLRGTGKFCVLGAATADWAVVSATLTFNKKENQGTHLFLVQLREGGALRPGVKVSPIQHASTVYAQAGAAVVHFDSVSLPVEHLLSPYAVDGAQNTLMTISGQEGRKSAVEVLRVRSRLTTAALLLGTLKRLNSNVLLHASEKCMLGPDRRRNYPYMGFQHIQTPLVGLVAKSYVYIGAWHRLLPSYCDIVKHTGKGTYDEKEKKTDVKNNNKKETNKESDYTTPLEERISYEDDMQLAGLLYFLQKSILEFHQFGNQFLGLHGSFYGMGLQAATDLVHARLEGPDVTHLAREVALKSVIKNVGTTHWGWWLSNMFEMIPSLDRFFKNPWYSPRIAELGRHLIFFSHKHYSTKKRLRYSREIERRRGGPEHQWYDWHMFRYDEVVHCGEAFMEMQFLTNMMSEMEVCSDPRARKLLRDIGWVFALTRQSESLPFLLLRKMMTPNKGVILQSHLDNIITVLAPQCVPLVTAMSVPLAWGAPADVEGYWSIPGTNINIQRGEALTTVEYGKTKQEQENIKEEEEEFDLFHGLADQPSYERKQKQK